MTEITRTTNNLILRALRLINNVAPDQSLAADKLNEGIEILNYILDAFQSSQIYIPFRQELSFSLSDGVADYYFGYNPSQTVISSNRILSLEFVHIVENDIKYPVDVITLQELENGLFDDTLEQRPHLVFMQKYPEYSLLRFKYTPDQTYTCQIWYKSPLAQVSSYEVLDDIPPYAHRFLMYAVAREFSSIYPTSSWDQKKESTYAEMKVNFTSGNDVDLQSRARMPFNRNLFNINGGEYY